MRLKKVKIGPLTYRISRDKSEFEADEEYPDAMYYGQSQHLRQVIVIHPELQDDAAREVLVHELLHCVLHQGAHNLDFEEEEQVVRAIAPLLTLTLQNNEGLVDFITGK